MTMNQKGQAIQQLPALLRDLPSNNTLTDSQWDVLSAIVETVIPAILPISEKTSQHEHCQYLEYAEYTAATRAIGRLDALDQNLRAQYLAESPLTNTEFKDTFHRLVFQGLDGDTRARLLFILSVLNGRASILLTGYTTRFIDLPLVAREQIFHGWATARLSVFRELHRSLTQMVHSIWTRNSPSLRLVLSIPATPINHSFGPGYDFSFVQIPPAPVIGAVDSANDFPEILETDVLIVGSGCTGAVAASVLAASGLSVIVADKAYYWSPKHLPMSENAGMAHLFLQGGFTISDAGNMNIAAGSCFGGGGTVNWSASLQLQGFVRQEWATKYKLPYFTSGAFQADMDAVCERMGVGTASVTHNFGNQRLLSGARKLGMNGKTVPQNTSGEAHECGYCTLGCGSCGKKGPTESWLPDAARNGTQFVEGFQCHRVLFSDKLSEHGDKIAIGAEGSWTSRDEHGGVAGATYSRLVKIMARKAVVVSSGALGTPHLLQRSGITNTHLGKHLHLHPVSFLAAVYDEDVRPWEGSILTSVINDFENINSSGFGVKLEATAMIPSLFLSLFPWKSGLEWKLFCAKMRRMTGYISLARDHGEGKVYVDPKDHSRIRVDYTPDKKDRKHIAIGLIAHAKIQFIEGAREIHVSVPGVPAFIRQGDAAPSIDGDGINDPVFAEWLTNLERLIHTGFPANNSFASAHQMGTARMGTSPEVSVVNSEGRVWGTQRLHVVDTSVFPAASGVNPMITSMATARALARGIAGTPVAGEARAKL